MTSYGWRAIPWAFAAVFGVSASVQAAEINHDADYYILDDDLEKFSGWT